MSTLSAHHKVDTGWCELNASLNPDHPEWILPFSLFSRVCSFVFVSSVCVSVFNEEEQTDRNSAEKIVVWPDFRMQNEN